MNDVVTKELEKADWKTLSPSLLRFAHHKMMRFLWRGKRLCGQAALSSAPLLVDGKGAEDFISEALTKLANGDRTYRKDLSLEDNFQRTIESLISNHHKKASNQLIKDKNAFDATDDQVDPIEELSDDLSPRSDAEAFEQITQEKEMLSLFYDSIKDDEELTQLVMAFEEEKYKPAEIEQATGIPAGRVSELKRKLTFHVEKFLTNHPEFAELRPQKELK